MNIESTWTCEYCEKKGHPMDHGCSQTILHTKIESLQKENKALSEKLADMQMQADFDSKMVKQVSHNIEFLIEQNIALEKELATAKQQLAEKEAILNSECKHGVKAVQIFPCNLCPLDMAESQREGEEIVTSFLRKTSFAMKITKELRSDLVHISANLGYFTDKQLGKLIREIIERELTKEKSK